MKAKGLYLKYEALEDPSLAAALVDKDGDGIPDCLQLDNPDDEEDDLELNPFEPLKDCWYKIRGACCCGKVDGK